MCLKYTKSREVGIREVGICDIDAMVCGRLPLEMLNLGQYWYRISALTALNTLKIGSHCGATVLPTKPQFNKNFPKVKNSFVVSGC